MTTWSGYHSRMKDWGSLKPQAEIDILPLFPDKSMQFSSILGDVTPLFPDKSMQFPSILGDVKYVILIGGPHNEEKAHFICGSGWGVGDV